MGKCMGPSALGQFWGAEFKQHWYTGVEWGFQPHFHYLKSCSGESNQCIIINIKRDTLVNTNTLH